MMRIWLLTLLFLGFSLETSAKIFESWTAWLHNFNTIIQVDQNGQVLQQITLNAADGYQIQSAGASHDGRIIAYVVVDYATFSARFYLIDAQTGQVRLKHDLPTKDGFYGEYTVMGSENFSLDDTAFALPEYGESDTWRILIFDVQTGTITHTLSGETFNNSVRGMDANSAIIYRFDKETVTFVPVTTWNNPLSPENAFRWSIDWHTAADTFSENCAYTHANHDTIEPSGLVIESAIHAGLGYVPDADVTTTPYALEFYDPETKGRQVFYRSSEFLPHNPTFVQNGERIAFWGDPQAENSGLRRLVIIERDGSIIDQVDVLGTPTIKGVPNGFLYTTIYDVSGGVSELTFVNTRGNNPFADQTVIWESQPDELFRVFGADSESEVLTTDVIPWADYMSFNPNCPPYRG
jgi:hypothetical protein